MASGLSIELPPEALEAIAQRTAAIVLDRMRNQAPEPWLDTAQAAAHLGISASTLRALAASGAVESVQDSERGRRRFRRCDLDAWRTAQ